MNATTRTSIAITGFLFSLLMMPLAGCGGAGSLGGTAAADSGTLLSVVEDSEFGQYELVASTADASTGKWQFQVESRRNTRGDFTFVWDLGDGTTAEGINLEHTFDEPGSYVITVTALDDQDLIAFTLTLTVDVTLPTNAAPTALVGADQTVDQNKLVFLFAGESVDDDGDPITFSWSQVSGPPVHLNEADTATASFVTPQVDADTVLEFVVTVSDGDLTAEATVAITVLASIDPASIGPVADAGPDLTVTTAEIATLDGSGSRGATASSTAADALTYEWTQVSGRSVSLDTPTEAITSFVTPNVTLDEQLVFELMVTEGDASSVDEAIVTIEAPSSDGPDTPPVDDPTQQDGNDVVVVGDGDETTGVGCFGGTSTWLNTAFGSRSGLFTAEFDASADDDQVDAVVGLSLGAGSAFSDFAALVRFNTAGEIDVRSGGTYASDTTLTYAAGSIFHVRMVVDVATHSYSVFVTPQGSSNEIALATDYGFRTGQTSVTSLDNVGIWAGLGSHEVCDFTIVAGGPLSAGAGADKSIVTGGSTTLDGSASGGTGVYTYAWTPSTGLSSTTIARPTASPSSTTTYTLTVSDSEGASASDSVRVTVESAPLTANAGPDLSIVSGGSTVLQGSATGGVPPYSYRWSPSTGLSSTTSATPTASPAGATTYTLTVTDNAGTDDTDTVRVNLISGNVFYVATNQSGASDSNPGTSANPWKTLAKAASTARAGDTVLVKAGVYNQTLRPQNSGSSSAPIIFRADPADACVGGFRESKTGCAVVLDGQDSLSHAVDLYPKNYIRIEGFEMRDYASSVVHVAGSGSNTNHHIEVVNNFIHDCPDSIGVEVQSGTDVLIENNELLRVYRGVKLKTGSTPNRVTIRGNHIWQTYCDGVRSGGSNLLIEENLIHDAQPSGGCHRDGLDLANTIDGLIVRNNIIYDYTQLVYFPTKDFGNDHLSNIQIYGNILYLDGYPGDPNGAAPGIFMDVRSGSCSGRDIVIHSNTIGPLNGYSAIQLLGTGNNIQNVTIRNNLLNEADIDLSSVVNLDSDYNLFYQAQSNSSEGSHSQFNTNPRLVNPDGFDYRLLSASPAIDRGDPNLAAVVGLALPFVDIYGNTRPFDVSGVGNSGSGAYDIGAHEYAP